MKFSIDIKPLSVNQAWQGRRFSTKLKKQFDRYPSGRVIRASRREARNKEKQV